MKLLHPSLAAGAVVALGILAPTPASAGLDRGGAVEVDVALDGRQLDEGSAPFALDPDEELLVELVVGNGTDEDVTVRKVRVAGDELGMTFFAFSTQVDVFVPAGTTEARTFAIDVADLEGQANGLLDGRVELIGAGGEVLASRGFTADARGAFTATSSMFGVAVAILTAVLLLGVVLGLRRGTLPANRFNRALRFAEPGAGLGLVLAATLSSLRIALVPAPVGLAALAIGAGVGFVVGYTLARTDEGVVEGVAAIATPPVPAPSLAG